MHTRQRLVALFLFVVFVGSSYAFPLTVYAVAANQPTANDLTKVNTLSGPMAKKSADSPLAADATARPGQGIGKAQIGGTALSGPIPKPTFTEHELVEKRTVDSTTTQHADGTVTTKHFLSPHFFQRGTSLQPIDTTLIDDPNPDDANLIGQALAGIGSLFSPQTDFIVKDNDWLVRFSSSNAGHGMVRVKLGTSQVSFSPVNANNVDPFITKNSDGTETILYANIWPGVDVVYVVTNESLKESIILKNKDSTTSIAFRTTGGQLKAVTNPDGTPGGFNVIDALSNQFTISPLNFVLNHNGPVSDGVNLAQTYSGNTLTISVDKAYVRSLPATNFPAVIDPGLIRSYFGTAAHGVNYESFKSDGYVCPWQQCNVNAGSLVDGGVWKYWRGAFYSPYEQFRNSSVVLLHANVHLEKLVANFWTGDNNSHWFGVYHATCLSYGCIGMQGQSAPFVSTVDLDATNIYQAGIQAGDFGRWIMVLGEEAPTNGFRTFYPDSSYVDFTYNTIPPTPSVVSPSADGQVFTDPQVSFQTTPVGDADGDPVQYYFRVATGADGETGTVINSGNMATTQWTVPDGVLQDGMTYYLHVYSFDGTNYSVPSTVRPFKIDMRRGKDKTQTYDTVGPLTVDLATGNLSTGAGSHTSSALAGSLGVTLDYNSPLRSRNGLVGEYWNVPANYLGGAPTSPALLTRVDRNIGFNWNQSSPSSGTITNDWFYARWTGYFVAPTAGSYTFGGSNDDAMAIWVNNQLLYNTGCYSGNCYGTSITLSAGQVVPIRVEYQENTSTAFAHLMVKGAVAEQVVPQSWLQTGIRSVVLQNGLNGTYYTDDGTHNLDSTTKAAFLTHVDPVMSFNWGTGSPVAGGNVDFMARWSGYITVPVNDTYQFGTNADDGARIRINGNLVADNWAAPCCTLRYGSAVTLSAGTYPISVDYYDAGGAASLYLYVKGSLTPEQVIPSGWLTPKAQVLPAGWNLGIDPDGNISYDHLTANSSTVSLSDSTGDTHTYTATSTAQSGYTAYKPPVNEYGQLARNSDNTYTLSDVDGKTYIFGIDGTILSVTNPVDDLHPAALRYTYVGSPVRITRISDGVDQNRYAAVYYSGDTSCGAAPSGYDAQAPANMLCAVVTNDGRTTYFYYSNGLLSRILKPGNEATDYQYDAYGRLTAIRDSLANDAVAAGVRLADGTETTQITYDAIGRVASVTAPAATAGATRQQKTFEYSQYGSSLNRFINTTNWDHQESMADTLAGYRLEYSLGTVLENPLPGTRPLYSCRISWDEFTSLDPNCEGQSIIGFVGYVYALQPSDIPTVPVYRCTIGGEHFDSNTSNCEGYVVEFLLGYALSGTAQIGSAREHIAGAAEPNGFSQQVIYDSIFRTVTDTDKANLTTVNLWDNVKDLLYSATDATGLESTTLYDGLDRPTDSYGPAPRAWFGSDRKPLAAYASQVPHSQTNYDENIHGLSVAIYGDKTLTGAPKLHATAFNNAPYASYGVDLTTGGVTPTDGLSYRASGKILLSQAGMYSFRLWHSGGARVIVDDTLVVNDWADGAERYSPSDTFSNTMPNTWVDYSVEVYKAGTSGRVFGQLFMTPPGGAEQADVSGLMTPNYSLATSTTTFDAQLGNRTSKTDFGATPEFGLARSVTVDPTGLNLTASSAYEAPGANSFLRQVSKTLPGGVTTNYAYYGATDTVDNPCTTTVEAYRESGMLRLKTEPDPDGVGPQVGRTTETIYDDAGNVVATRYNQDPWTCTTYDTRDRALTTVVPAQSQWQPSRAITNNYAVGGNPFTVSTTDSSGTITTSTDLLGRVTSYTDTNSDTTTSTYDAQGHLASRSGPLGLEEFTYDQYDRLTDQKLDAVLYAHVVYDQYSRVDSVTYPAAAQQKVSYVRDSLGRLSGLNYALGSGTAGPSDAVTRSASGDIMSGTENGTSKSYAYDTAGRLTAATVGTTIYAYDYSAPTSAQCAQASANVNANKDSNRTKMTINGAATTYCYDYADRLIGSSDPNLDVPQYDAHGNTIQLGSGSAPLRPVYDASDRSRGIEQYDGSGNGQALYYSRDAQGRIAARYKNSIQNWAWIDTGDTYYGFTGSGDTPDFMRDANWNIVEKYLQLPGNVLVTIRPSVTDVNAKTTYSLPNLHGDIFATSNATGVLTGTFASGPFGEVLSATTQVAGQGAQPNNTPAGSAYGYVGQYEKITETAFTVQLIQMGARVYVPSMGRFLQVDPVEGGTPNNYVYPVEPVNDRDLDGNASQRGVQGSQGQQLSEAEESVLQKYGNQKPRNPIERKVWTNAKNKLKNQEKYSGDRRSRNNRDKNRRGPTGGAGAPSQGSWLPNMATPKPRDLSPIVIWGGITVVLYWVSTNVGPIVMAF